MWLCACWVEKWECINLLLRWLNFPLTNKSFIDRLEVMLFWLSLAEAERGKRKSFHFGSCGSVCSGRFSANAVQKDFGRCTEIKKKRGLIIAQSKSEHGDFGTARWWSMWIPFNACSCKRMIIAVLALCYKRFTSCHFHCARNPHLMLTLSISLFTCWIKHGHLPTHVEMFN